MTPHQQHAAHTTCSIPQQQAAGEIRTEARPGRRRFQSAPRPPAASRRPAPPPSGAARECCETRGSRSPDVQLSPSPGSNNEPLRQLASIKSCGHAADIAPASGSQAATRENQMVNGVPEHLRRSRPAAHHPPSSVRCVVGLPPPVLRSRRPGASHPAKPGVEQQQPHHPDSENRRGITRQTEHAHHVVGNAVAPAPPPVRPAECPDPHRRYIAIVASSESPGRRAEYRQSPVYFRQQALPRSCSRLLR